MDKNEIRKIVKEELRPTYDKGYYTGMVDALTAMIETATQLKESAQECSSQIKTE